MQRDFLMVVQGGPGGPGENRSHLDHKIPVFDMVKWCFSQGGPGGPSETEKVSLRTRIQN